MSPESRQRSRGGESAGRPETADRNKPLGFRKAEAHAIQLAQIQLARNQVDDEDALEIAGRAAIRERYIESVLQPAAPDTPTGFESRHAALVYFSITGDDPRRVGGCLEDLWEGRLPDGEVRPRIGESRPIRRVAGVSVGEGPQPSSTPGVTSARLHYVRKGSVEFLADGQAVIRLFQASDVSTRAHASAPIFRRGLTNPARETGDPSLLRDLRTAETWAGVENGRWTAAAEEKFARAWEQYLAEVQARRGAPGCAAESL